jgi:uncharacterized protein (DUF849 family)
MLQACLNGARHRAQVRNLPVTPSEIADAADACVRAAADDVHVHPKDAGGLDSLEPGIVGAALAAVRERCPGVPIGVTTGAWAARDTE